MENRLLARFPGVIGFPVTPFNAADEFDEAAFRTNTQFMLDSELAAIAFCGSNGEMPSLTLPEYERIAAIGGEMLAGSKGLIMGVGQTLKTAQHMARTARKAGAEAILLVAPYSNDRNLPGLADYYRRVAGAAEIPVFLYQTKWSGVLELELLDMLTDVENILMVKDENGSLSHFMNVRSHFGDRFTWINGMAEPFVPAYWNMGIQTFTSGLACFMPKTTIEILRLAQVGDFPGINRLLNDVIVPLYAIRNRKAGYKCSMIKTAMELCGLPGGLVRSPLIEMSPEDRADLDALLIQTNLKPAVAAV